MADLQALLFDVFGTVVDWRSSIATEVAATLGSQQIDLDWYAFAMAWRAGYQPAMEPIRRGERAFENLDRLHLENLLRVLDAFAVPTPDTATLDRLTTAWHRLDPWPDSVQGLMRLKQAFIIAPCSNGHIALIVNMAKRAGLPWDVVLGAELAQTYKPAPEVYLKSAALLDLRPDQCMMVAAHNSDLAAAQALGFTTAFVARPHEYGPDQVNDLAPTGNWDVVAGDFLDLADRLIPDCG